MKKSLSLYLFPSLSLSASASLFIILSLFVRVVGVEPDRVTLLDKSSGHQCAVPCGMCVWSTGVAPRELTRKMLLKIQSQKRG